MAKSKPLMITGSVNHNGKQYFNEITEEISKHDADRLIELGYARVPSAEEVSAWEQEQNDAEARRRGDTGNTVASADAVLKNIETTTDPVTGTAPSAANTSKTETSDTSKVDGGDVSTTGTSAENPTPSK